MMSQKCIANEGPNEDAIATLSICLYNILLNIKYNSFILRIQF